MFFKHTGRGHTVLVGELDLNSFPTQLDSTYCVWGNGHGLYVCVYQEQVHCNSEVNPLFHSQCIRNYIYAS